MKQEAEFSLTQVEYSKQLSECKSGLIVAKNEQRWLIINAPELSAKEEKFFCTVLEEIKHVNKEIKANADVYFLLKEFCLENLVLLGKEQREKILTLLEWETIGESILTPLLRDPSFEEIVINGPKKPIMVYHITFGWLTTNAWFNSEEKIKTIINKMAAPLGRQLSYHSPLLNAVLKDGSRLNASMNPIAFSGINATIRKFKENPFTPSGIVQQGTIEKKAMGFLWLAMQTSCSILICGNTGSGKTTTLNALFCFLPKEERIVVAEETPELLLPQNHTIKLNTAEQVNVTLSTLVDNTFRMRPDRVIVGEIRNKEEANAFVNTMLAGQAKGSYATFHAESAQEALQRLVSFGIEERTLASLDLIVVQKRINLMEKGIRKEERKIVEICEVVKEKNSVKAKKLFEYNFSEKKLEEKNPSQKVMEKICRTFSCKKKEAEKMLKRKENLLEAIGNKISFGDFFEAAEKIEKEQ
jgi:Flp pilus assembly CpaF family ATPase